MMKTRIFFDTKFTGLQKNTTLISIGFISECGKQFYAEFADYNKSQLNDWLIENVMSGLSLDKVGVSKLTDNEACVKGDRDFIKDKLEDWLVQFDEIEMWSDCLGYNWVLFCDIFGGAQSIPENVYDIPFDLCTLMLIKGEDPDATRVLFAYDELRNTKINQHNALFDAQLIKLCYDKIEGLSETKDFLNEIVSLIEEFNEQGKDHGNR